jgi:hypothetical protein
MGISSDEVMTGFEVVLNGRRLCIAGAGEHGTLTTIISSVGKRSELMLEVGGLSDDAHLTWAVPSDLSVGDEVIVRVVEVEQADPPATSRRDDRKLVEAGERALYERLKQKYEQVRPNPTVAVQRTGSDDADP